MPQQALPGIWRHADARNRGMKRVQVEPHLSVTGAVSAEWVPIKPKTDAAFLYGVIHRIICERLARGLRCPLPNRRYQLSIPDRAKRVLSARSRNEKTDDPGSG